jgi:predicted nuclease of restriction endonuclease-like (RecB) superfamily
MIKKKHLMELKSEDHEAFHEVHEIVQQARTEAFRQANKVLITLYFSIGRYISEKTTTSNWGMSIVDSLSEYLVAREPSIKGFSPRNLWRMKQFYETYKNDTKLTTALTEITWSNHLHILSKTKSVEERRFYLELTAKNHYSARDLSRLIDSGTFERTMLANQKLSTVLTEFPVNTSNVFKDVYLFEFTGLTDGYHELDLQALLLKHLRKFLLEMGPDFSFIAEQYLVQVGTHDYKIDLLLHHRGLNCLVAVELKITDFKPEYLGKLQFYLEALDKDVKKPHENPSIGLLICKTKDDEVVKYAMNRSVSPALVAEYETQLIDKSLLERKLHELSEVLVDEDNNKLLDKLD